MLSYALEAQHWNETKRMILERINASGLPLVLFGQTSAVNPSLLTQIKVKTEYIFDNASSKWGRRHWGLTVCSPDDCPYSRYNVLILVPFVDEITNQLRRLPSPPQQIFYLDLYFEEEDSAAFFDAHRQQIDWITQRLADRYSQSVFQQVIRYRVNRRQSYLEGITLPRSQQYFPEQLGKSKFLHNHEVFADAGAFVGDTIAAFRTAVNDQYCAIYAFEPDADNFKALTSLCANVPNITCFHAGVGKKEAVVSFCSDTSSSKVSTDGTQRIHMVALDHKLSNLPITYIKMDVEGMECDALRGAAKIIRTHRPKLAVCTYHSNADMLAVPKLIWELNPEYQLYIRHYTKGVVETVCFAR